MAADNVNTTQANIYDLATAIQAQTHRILSLSHAIDDALDGVPDAKKIGRAFDYLGLLAEAAESARAAAEEIESLDIKRRHS
jgi:hypothetical protein